MLRQRLWTVECWFHSVVELGLCYGTVSGLLRCEGHLNTKPRRAFKNSDGYITFMATKVLAVNNTLSTCASSETTRRFSLLKFLHR